MGRLLTLGLFYYNSDIGQQFVVSISIEKASVGNFSPAPAMSKITLPAQMRMRYVIGVDASNNSVIQPVADRSNALFQGGGNFTYEFDDFEVTARIAEKYTGRM